MPEIYANVIEKEYRIMRGDECVHVTKDRGECEKVLKALKRKEFLDNRYGPHEPIPEGWMQLPDSEGYWWCSVNKGESEPCEIRFRNHANEISPEDIEISFIGTDYTQTIYDAFDPRAGKHALFKKAVPETIT